MKLDLEEISCEKGKCMATFGFRGGKSSRFIAEQLSITPLHSKCPVSYFEIKLWLPKWCATDFLTFLFKQAVKSHNAAVSSWPIRVYEYRVKI
jgi:hypothetical protein